MIDSHFLLEVQLIRALHGVSGEEESTTQFLSETSTFSIDSPNINNSPVLELDNSPNCIQENLIEESMSANGHQDNVDILIPSLNVYSQSPKLVSSIQTMVKRNSFHPAPTCQPLIVDLQEEAVCDKQPHAATFVHCQ